MIEIASTNTSMIAMPIKILDAADGLRLSAIITAYPRTEITTEGPSTAMNITIKIMNVSASITSLSGYRPDPEIKTTIRMPRPTFLRP